MLDLFPSLKLIVAKLVKEFHPFKEHILVITVSITDPPDKS
jgi:hypothetical protein